MDYEAIVKIKLSPARELNFDGFAVSPFKTAFFAQLASSWAQLGANLASNTLPRRLPELLV